MKDKLIIFDMDNTVLRSNIDFPFMKKTVDDMLLSRGLACFVKPSTAATIMAYSESADADPDFIREMWQKVAEIEAEGLRDSVLEPNVISALDSLSSDFELAVLTNNTDYHLEDNLGRLGLLPYLSCVAGRDSVPRLKPAPDGMLWVMEQFPSIPKSSVITVGDAIIDAEAAYAAGIKFVAYNSSRKENWKRVSPEPLLKLTEWTETCSEVFHQLIMD